MASISTRFPAWLLPFVAGAREDAALSDDERAQLRAQQIGVVVAPAPAMMGANLVNCAITVNLFRGAWHDMFLLAWRVALVGFLGFWLQQWRIARRFQRERASVRGLRRVATMALLAAILWAAPTGEPRLWSLTGRPLGSAGGASKGFLAVGADGTQARRAEAAIRRMAPFDGLTGLPNRALLHQEPDAAIAGLSEAQGGFALLTHDPDRFRHVNDTLGHGVGDRMLVEVGQRIASALRPRDAVARFGGDGFVILQRSANQPADALGARLVETLSAPYKIDGALIVVGVGVALAPDNGENGDDLLPNCNLALYRAKADGRGPHRFYPADMRARSKARRLLEIDLREALKAGALDEHFQPLVDIQSAGITACEALARWAHTRLGDVPPTQFIPLAEETGLIVALGAFVLKRACAAAATWKGDIRVAVNLSALQFKSGDLVRETLADTGLPASRLEFEITKSILIEDKDEVLRRLFQLRALGVRTRLDDFGTGYSSLSHLSSFPFDKIKIDRSFVPNVAERPDAAAITKLGNTLGIGTTAEGAETQAELDWLRENGCAEAQGFLICEPLPAAAIALLTGLKAEKTERCVA